MFLLLKMKKAASDLVRCRFISAVGEGFEPSRSS